MKVSIENDGKYLLVSNGTEIENQAIMVLVEMLSKCKLPCDEFNDSFGTGFDNKVAKNFIYIPDISFCKVSK